MRYLLFFLALTVPSFAYADLSTLISEGDALRLSFDNKGALAKYETAHEQAPENFIAETRRLQSLVDVGEDIDGDLSEEWYLKAVKGATQLVKKSPDRAEAYYLLALSNGKLAKLRGGKEKVKLSRTVYENGMKAVELDPEPWRPYLLLGVYHREVANLNWFLKMFAENFFGGLPEGSNEGSIDNLNKCIERNPESLLAYYERALTYFVIGENEKALADLGKVATLPTVDHLDGRYKALSAKLLKKKKR